MMKFKTNPLFSGIERPDIRQLGILSFATIVHNAYSTGKLSESKFNKYVRTYFDSFLGKKLLTPFSAKIDFMYKYRLYIFVLQTATITSKNYCIYKHWEI